MPLESYVCPNCGSPLNVDTQNGFAECQYCGTQFTTWEDEYSSDNAQHRMRNSDDLLEIISPRIMSYDDIFIFWALWILGKPYLDYNKTRNIRWLQNPVLWIVPIYHVELEYTANYYLEVGVEQDRRSYNSRRNTYEKVVEWYPESGQVTGIRKVDIWSRSVYTSSLLAQSSVKTFRLTCEMTQINLSSLPDVRILPDERPSRADMCSALGNDLKRKVNGQYITSHTRHLTVSQPDIHILDCSVTRLPLWNIQFNDAQNDYELFMSASYPSDCVGKYPENTERKSDITGYNWCALVILMMALIFVIIGFVNHRAGESLLPTAIGGLLEGAIAYYVYQKAKEAELNMSHVCEDLARRAVDILKDASRSIDLRWNDAISYVKELSNRKMPNNDKVKAVSLIIAFLLLLISIVIQASQ